MQSVSLSLPVPPVYWPLGQAVHGNVPPSPKYPASHRHVDTSLEMWLLPVGQAVHGGFPPGPK